MDKNDHLHGLLGGHSERIGDWTPQQLAAFIQSQSNDPTQVPHAFGVKSIQVAENIILGGKQLEHAVIPRAVTMGDAKGKAIGIYPQHSGTQTLNGAYAALDPTAKKVFAETYDIRNTSIDMALNDSQMRMTAIYVPHKERLTNMYMQYSVFEAGGTFTYGGYAIYGPLAYDPTIPGINKASIPQVAITETNLVSNFRVGGPHFVQSGYHAMTGNPAWDIVLEAGLYCICVLYVFSVAPGTLARLIGDTNPATYPGISDPSLGVPGFLEAGTLNRTTLPATLDLTLGGWAFSDTRMWAAFYNDNTKQI